MTKRFFYTTVVLLLCIISCRNDQYEVPPPYTCYPPSIEKIITTKCSRSGCHNTTSKIAAGGLDLSTWDKMYEGTGSGAVVVPFNTKYSTLLYYCNTDSLEGIISVPTMPLNESPLSKEEYSTLRDWIADGARCETGALMFDDNPQRRKIYIANQGCDNVAVIDADKKVIMRYVDVGVSPLIESSHMIRVTPDNKYWIVVFLGSPFMQVYDAVTDKWVRDIPIGTGQWNTFAISSDSKKAVAADYLLGKVEVADIETGAVTVLGNFGSSVHGTALNQTNDTVYVGLNGSYWVRKIPINDPFSFEDVNLNGNLPIVGNLKPHEILFTPDFSKYIVTCEGTSANQVRIFSTSDDQLVAAINVGVNPVEMALSVSKNLLFVTNMADVTFANTVGSVSVIDLNTLQEIKKIEVGWNPHGITIDEVNGLVYVTNRNIDPNGPIPHHTTSCNGRNGYLSVIDLNTLTVNSKIRAELSVDPYGAAIKN